MARRRSLSSRLLIAAILILAAVAFAGCGSASTSTQTFDTSPGAYSPSVQGELVGGCEGTGKSASWCGCALKYAEATLSESQIPKPVWRAGSVIPGMAQFDKACGQ